LEMAKAFLVDAFTREGGLASKSKLILQIHHFHHSLV
jgi:hypothetical protein